MRFVPVKSAEQQAILVVHRLRASTVRQHTRGINQIRGLLAEFGVVAPRGSISSRNNGEAFVTTVTNACLHSPGLSSMSSTPRSMSYTSVSSPTTDRFAPLSATMNALSDCPRSTVSAPSPPVRLSLPWGTHEISKTGVSLLPGSVSPRDNTQPAVELDSVAITKRGDIYLRTLLVHGARSELIHTPGRKDTKSRWVENLKHTKSWRHFAQVLNFRFEIRREPPNL